MVRRSYVENVRFCENTAYVCAVFVHGYGYDTAAVSFKNTLYLAVAGIFDAVNSFTSQQLDNKPRQILRACPDYYLIGMYVHSTKAFEVCRNLLPQFPCTERITAVEQFSALTAQHLP